MGFYIGTDPELAIVNDKGEPVPAWQIFPPKSRKMSWGTTSAFYDGAAVEINTSYTYCREVLATYVLQAQQNVRMQLPPGYRLVATPAWVVDLKKTLTGAPNDSLIFGCEPSWNAYTHRFEGVALDATEHNVRYAGGHLHISLQKERSEVDPHTYKRIKVSNLSPATAWLGDQKQVERYIKMLDRYLGIPLAVWFNKPEAYLRREYYGKAGEYRLQDYGGEWLGVEYRVPGPEVWNSPVVASFAQGVMRQVAHSFNGLVDQNDDLGLQRDIRKAINTGKGLYDLFDKCYLDFEGQSKERYRETIGRVKPFQELIQRPAFDPNMAGRAGWSIYHELYKTEAVYMKLFHNQPAEQKVAVAAGR